MEVTGARSAVPEVSRDTTTSVLWVSDVGFPLEPTHDKPGVRVWGVWDRWEECGGRLGKVDRSVLTVCVLCVIMSVSHGRNIKYR